MTIVGWGAAVFVAIYIVYAAVMVAIHPRLIYPFQPQPFDPAGYEIIPFDIDGRGPLPIVVHRGEMDSAVIVYFMGNVGSLELFRVMLDYHKSKGRSVVAMPFRGGGGVAGRPSEAILKRDAEALLQNLDHFGVSGPVIVQGYSLGTGLALHAAARVGAEGVILSAPYASLCQLAARVSLLPACWLPFVQKWDNRRYAGQIEAPVLVQHGRLDRLIPIRFGEALADHLSAGGADLQFFELPDAAHNDLFDAPGYLSQMDRFVEDVQIDARRAAGR